jgi:hypothetical protein
MLEYALGTGVMDELFPTDEPFLHQNLAPGTEAVGQVNSRCIRKSSHGGVLFLSVVTLSTDWENFTDEGEIFLTVTCVSKKTWYSSRNGQPMCLTLLQKGSDLL